jgi:hypothetical protein
MMLKIAIFLSAVAVLYFVVKFLRSRWAAGPPLPTMHVVHITRPPTMDVVYIVRVFMLNGRWGFVMQKHLDYYRFPMLFKVDPEKYRVSTSLSYDLVGCDGQITRLAVFTASDEFSYPRGLPLYAIHQVNAAFVVDCAKNANLQGLSATSRKHLCILQRRVQHLTGVADFKWFLGEK